MQANDTLVRGSPATIVIPACEDIATNHQGGCRRPCQTAYWEGNCQLAEMKVARPESSRRRGWYEALYCNPRRSSDAQTCSSGATGLPPRVGWFSLVYNLTPRPMKNSDSGAEGEPMKRTASIAEAPVPDWTCMLSRLHMCIICMCSFSSYSSDYSAWSQVCMLYPSDRHNDTCAIS
jgi:hypothetical protein